MYLYLQEAFSKITFLYDGLPLYSVLKKEWKIFK